MRSNKLLVWMATFVIMSAYVVLPKDAIASDDRSPADVTISPRFDAEVYNRFAVYIEDRTGRRIKDGVIRSIDDEFTRAAMTYGYTVASRSDREAIEKELDAQDSPWTEEAMAKRGRALNVPATIWVSINALEVEKYKSALGLFVKSEKNKRYYRANISVSARMLDAESGEVLWLSSFSDKQSIGSRKDYNSAAEAIPEVASEVAMSLPPR